MQQYKFLALTDHRGHSKENSLYAILSRLVTHPQCALVDVASRGNEMNHSFFYENEVKEIHVHSVSENFSFEEDLFAGEAVKRNFNDYDVVLMRLPRPIDNLLFQKLEKNGKDKVFINAPKAIEKTSTKAYLLNFKEWCPPIQLCYSPEEILDFAEQFPIVLKPLKEFGGKGILKIDGAILNDGKNNFDTKSYLKAMEPVIKNEGYLAMKFLKNVSKGDKRIIVVGGEIMVATLRKPSEGSWLCNVAQGGMSEGAEPDEREIRMVAEIAPKLMAEGVFIFGADTLVDDDGKRVLSEINTLSIGGFPQAEAQTGRPIINDLINKIMQYVHDKKRK